jgi:hypothetical protein
MSRVNDARSPSGAAIPLWDSTHFSMSYRVGDNILVLKRKSQPIESLRDYQRECTHLMELMRDNANVRGIVIDMRDAQARQDPAYERATHDFSEFTFATYRRVAMLFRSVAGALQMRRFAGDRGDQLLSTTVEGEALAFASRRS